MFMKLVILYGSQTGNGEDLAERIRHESQLFRFKSTAKCMNDYNIVELTREQCVIFICSTTGQGEEPDNMKQFWKFLLRKNLPTDSLSNLKFAVFGLGDSSYAKFNFAAKRLHKRLLHLGAQPILPLGLGDDQHDLGYDAAADPWIQNLWKNLLLLYPLPTGVTPLSYLPILPRWRVLFNNNAKPTQSLYYSTKKPEDFTVTVLDNVRLTDSDHFQDVRLIKFKTNGQAYSPGDVVSLRPKNLPEQVKVFREVLRSHNLDFDGVFELESPENPLPEVLQQSLTFEQLCHEYFDLMSIPRRRTFQILSQITDSDLEREKCLEFTTAEGQNDLYSYCNRPKRNIVEVLQDFPNATKNLSREVLFEILPAIKPRDFSIASSCKRHQNEIHVLLAVVRYKTKLVKERLGLASNYLADLREGDQIVARLKKGSLKFPPNNVPVIMVGPGTGVAPFRNFVFESLQDNSNENLLFYGCRNRNKDFLCKELLQLSQEGKLNLITAFSRDQEHKIYVQHKILENHEIVWRFLEKGGQIFVAGNAKQMPQEVREAFVKVCQISGKMGLEQAQKFIENLEKTNRYQTECWS